MTACNIYLGADAIQIWTDGAQYDADGTLLQINSKVGIVPHLNCALVVRGSSLGMPIIAHYAGLFPSFDDLVTGAPRLIAAVVETHGAVFEECSLGGEFEVYFAGWSDARGRAEGLRVRSCEPSKSDVLDDVLITPASATLQREMRAAFPGATDENQDFGDERFWRTLMGIQRNLHFRDREGRLVCGVGGFCQRTVITRSAVSTEIVEWYADTIGEKLGSACQ